MNPGTSTPTSSLSVTPAINAHPCVVDVTRCDERNDVLRALWRYAQRDAELTLRLEQDRSPHAVIDI